MANNSSLAMYHAPLAGKPLVLLFNSIWFIVSKALFRRFDVNEIVDEDANTFNVPSNIKTFLFDYKHSAFIECNRELALSIRRPNYTQNASQNKMVSAVMKYITESLEQLGKHYWLAGGTLLGWYRDCGIIPHTQDVDLALYAQEYDRRIKSYFLGNKKVRVWGTLGFVSRIV